MATKRLVTWRSVRWLLAGLTCIFPLLSLPLLTRSAYSQGGGGGDVLLLEEVLSAGILCLVIGAILTSFAFLFSKKSRFRGVALMSFGILLGVTTTMGMNSANKVRDAAIDRFARETEPLILAIKAYEHHHGAAPEHLEQLTPGFLPAIPDTGLSAAPRWQYSQDQWADGTVEWSLSVVAGIGLGEITYIPDPGCASSGAKVAGGTWCYWSW